MKAWAEIFLQQEHNIARETQNRQTEITTKLDSMTFETISAPTKPEKVNILRAS